MNASLPIESGSPQLRPGVEIVDHGEWSAAAAPPGGRFLRLSPAEAAWLRAGGSGTIAAPEGAEELLGELEAGGFLAGTPVETRRVRVSRQGIEFAGTHEWLARAYAGGLRHLFRPSVVALLVVVAVAGAVALIAQLAAGRPLATSAFAPLTAALIVLGLELACTLVHEVAHALYLVRHGRRVRGVGFGFYWGALSFFVDAGEALLLPRRRRMLQSAIGPLSDIVLAGAASLLALTLDGPIGSIFLLYAVFAWLDVAINLVPFLELDGYWILADYLDRPQLRAESWSAVRQRVSGEGGGSSKGLAAYGLVSAGFGVILLLAGVWGWWLVVGDLLKALLNEGPLGWLMVVPLAMPTLLAWLGMILQLTVGEERQ